MKANVTYWLDETAARFPDKAAYVDEKKEITFGTLRAQARAIGGELAWRGLFKRPSAGKGSGCACLLYGGGLQL